VFDETNNTEEQGLDFSENQFDDEATETDAFSDNDNHIETSEKAGETLRIKFNGEERDITLDEARTLAQKGLNYDHVVAERDTKYLRELEFLDRVAATQGMTRAEYISSVENSVKMPQEQSVAGDIGTETARAQEQIRRIKDSVGFAGPWGNLFRKYPSLSRESAYAELGDAVKGGMTPLEAYQEKLLSEKATELRIAKQNGDAAARAVGSLEGDGDGEDLDDFLIGFNSIYE